jgi:serine kinase of HPr protein (carbohydrate metabolism regulator)
MTAIMPSTIHASAVLIGARAVLIRGPSGSGKSRLALALLQAADRGAVRFARLVGDDRIQAEAAHGRLLLRPAPALAGMIEVHGLGIWRVPFEPVAVAGWLIDLAAADAGRLPEPAASRAEIERIGLPRLPVAATIDPLATVLAWIFMGAAQP